VTADSTLALSDLAAAQYGVFAIEQLPALGVYAMTGSPVTWHQHLQIGLLALGEQS
jgi:hypothetical protein